MPNGFLTTHVLDTSRGVPAGGIEIALYRVSGNSHRKIATAKTNADGRTDAPILDGANYKEGSYELIFFVEDYLRSTQPDLPETLFLSQIPIRFGVSDAEAHYHVPLLLSPFGYSTYRGS